MKTATERLGRFGLMFISIISVSCGLTAAAGQSPDLDEILNRHLKALGGRDAISRIGATAAYSTIDYQGVRGKMIIMAVPPSKYFASYTLGAAGFRMGYDGVVGWMTDANGISRRQYAEELKPMIDDVYFQNYAYAIPGLLPGKTVRRDDTLIAGRRYFCMALFPAGGDSLLIYINDVTGLIDYRVENVGGLRAVTTYTDYRPVAGVMTPFSIDLTTPGAPYRISSRLDSMKVNIRIPDSLFAPPAAAVEDFRFPPGADSAVIPFQLDDGHLYVTTGVNGRGPFRFLLDSGAGASLLAKRVADELGIVTFGDLPIRGVGGYGAIGLAEIDSLTLGGLCLYLKHVAVLTPISSGSEAFRKLDGILGYDFFARFAVSIDFEKRRIVISRSGKYSPLTEGRSIGLEVYAQIPVVEAEVDGQPIRMAVDLGAQAGLVIRGSAKALAAPGEDNSQTDRVFQIGGVGGLGSVRKLNIKRLTLAGFDIDNPPALAAEKFADFPMPEYIEGLLGVQILKDFNLIIDYQAGNLVLSRREH